MDMTDPLGELQTRSGHPLLKMWGVRLEPCERPFVRHSHARFEIAVVVSGSGEYTTERAVYPMRPGDVFVFSSNEVHCITHADEGGLVITNLHFEPRFLGEEFSESYGDSYLDFCLFHAPGFENRIPASRAETLRHCHDSIRAEFETRENAHSLAIHAYLNLILIELLRRHGYRADSASKSALPELFKVCDYIDRHLSEQLSLRQIAAAVGISPNYLSARFREWNGLTLWEYLTAKRIEKAVKLILTPDSETTMLEIALQCGFNSTVSFNKAFKKQQGCTPRELKKNGYTF